MIPRMISASLPLAGRRPVGMAVSPSRVYVAMPGSSRGAPAQSWPLDALGADDSHWPSLAAALREAREVITKGKSGDAVTVAVSLLPPLVQVRRIELPKLDPAAVRQLLSRTAGRYFPSVREPQLAHAVPLARSSPAPYLAASAARRVIDAIVQAAEEAGVVVETIVPAQSAWAVIARERFPRLRKEGGMVAVTHEQERATERATELLHLERGRLVQTRRIREDDRILPGDDNQRYQLDAPDSTAAFGAPIARGPELLTDTMSQRRAHVRVGLVKQIAIGLAACVLLVAGGVWWRARATLRDVVAQREALKPSVARALAGEREISTVRVAAQALGRVETDAVVWTDVLRDLFANLPKDASLLSVRTRNDTLLADGIAARGATVFQRLDDGTVLFDGIRPSGTIRREAKRGVTPADRFTLAGKVSKTAPLFAMSKKSQSLPMPAQNEELP